jgi:hypothetical protein
MLGPALRRPPRIGQRSFPALKLAWTSCPPSGVTAGVTAGAHHRGSTEGSGQGQAFLSREERSSDPEDLPSSPGAAGRGQLQVDAAGAATAMALRTRPIPAPTEDTFFRASPRSGSFLWRVPTLTF